MNLFTKILITYTAISLILYFVVRGLCLKNPVFRMPKHKATYYILSLTWGLPMTAFGGIVALILIICGKRAHKYGWGYYFEFDNINWGMELGVFFIVPTGDCIALKNHEHGHGIQNIYLGIFTPAVITIPSFLRYRYRELRTKLFKLENKTAYGSIWFEGSADASGNAFMNSFNRIDKS